LKDNTDKTLNELNNNLKGGRGTIYAYVLTTIKNENGQFVQTGSAPNLQGGLITLCTCKHYMRTYRKPNEWEGVWIAGFTSRDLMENNYLFYLMKVSEAFSSHKGIWDNLPVKAKKAKNARFNPCGDVYEPKPNPKDEFNYLDYHPPSKNHVHANNNRWHEDIKYEKSRTKRRPALLVGDPTFSFLWSQPSIHFKGKLPRTKKWDDIRYFIQLLK